MYYGVYTSRETCSSTVSSTKIGVLGFGRFGNLIARTFFQHGKVILTSRSDYTDISKDIGVRYNSLSDLAYFLDKVLDVILLIMLSPSFENIICYFAPRI